MNRLRDQEATRRNESRDQGDIRERISGEEEKYERTLAIRLFNWSKGLLHFLIRSRLLKVQTLKCTIKLS